MRTIVEWACVSLFIAVCGILVAIMFAIAVVYLPATLATDAECLRKGYPKSAVSIYLERYCMNLSGSVTVTVDKAGE